MTPLINWAKRHWFSLLLLLIIIVLIGNRNSNSTYSPSTLEYSDSSKMMGVAPAPAINMFRQAAPTESSNRLVIETTNLSLKVKNVADSVKSILSSAQSFGGFLVSSYLSQPEDAASGNITIRVPSDKRDQAVDAFKQIASKVVSESIMGDDVTDQYVDLDTQLSILNNTKQKFEEILNRAVTVTDLMSVQQQLMNIQSQIDSVKGQQKYLEQSSKLTKITIYLSTDELSLPYAPTNVWRPTVVFKEAVRSLLGSLQTVGSLLIWSVAYLPIIIPVLGLIWFYKKRQARVK